MSSIQKKRADEWLHDRGMSESRNKAQALIMAGEVYFKNAQFPEWTLVRKAGQSFPESTEFRLTNEDSNKDVGRGAQKLRGALNAWPQVVTEVSQALDIGSSTGGFTQALLERGAKKVVALDVGTHQLHEKLRSDPRVISVENQHVLKMTEKKWEELGLTPLFPLVVTDLSFISLTKILGAVIPWLEVGAWWIMLIKPQFELGPKKVPGGVVKDSKFHEEAIQLVREAVSAISELEWVGVMESPISGGSGNKEFLALVKRK